MNTLNPVDIGGLAIAGLRRAIEGGEADNG